MFQPLDIKVFGMDQIVRTPHLLSTCRTLSLGWGSGMNRALSAFESVMLMRAIEARGLIAYLDTIPIGWALLSKDELTDTTFFNPTLGFCFQVYVRMDLRRKGFGSQLLNKATQLAGSEKIRVYEDNTPGFFNRHMKDNSTIKSIYPEF